MANKLYGSYINPVSFFPLDPVRADQYTSRFLTDYQFRRTIQPWQQDSCWLQPWYQNDSIRLQYTSNFNPITLELYNEDGELLASQNFTTYHQDELRPTYYIRQTELDLAAFPPGRYFLKRIAAGNEQYSAPFEIFESPDPDEVLLNDPNPTIYIEYSNSEPYQDMKFFVPFTPAIRVPAVLTYKDTDSVDTMYRDQLLNTTMLNSVPFRVHTFDMDLVPPFFADKIKRIFGCDSLKLDGRLFTKNEGAKWEAVTVENVPLIGGTIELVESLNREGEIIENDVEIVGVAAAALIMENKWFGMDSENNYVEIEQAE
jgi:hypothetical protein